VTRATRAAGLALIVMVASCAGPPWFMGSPLDGHPSIPPWSAKLSYKEQRAAAATAQGARQTLLELRALLALDDLQRLTPANAERLVTLLGRRAAEFHALGRAIPESRDLEHLARLSPARGAGLLGERASAARDAGDAWLALGATDEARAAYERAASLGASDVDFRLRALWGHPPPATTTLAEMRAAIAALPLRAVPPLAEAYVTHGGTDGPTLDKGLAAARQEHEEALAARLGSALAANPAATTGADGGVLDGGSPAVAGAATNPGTPDAATDGVGADTVTSPRPLPSVAVVAQAPADFGQWLLEGPTLTARLLPLAAARPEVLDDVGRDVWWVDLLLAEDDASPDVLEFAALVFGRAGRFGGTERMLMELTYATPDRAAGLARAAGVWTRLGRSREACVQWIRAARWRDEPEDPTWRTAIACARREPGVADWREIRSYVLGRAPPDRRAALAATLDDGDTGAPTR
jgi:tetratricopeptide (TPR) repeat protein